MHAVELAPAYRPAAHRLHSLDPDEEAYRPATQATQVVWEAEPWKRPAAHAVQADESVLAYVPTWHTEQALDPDTANVPPEQPEAKVAPVAQ